MARKFALVASLTMTLFAARESSADVIFPINLDTFSPGILILGPTANDLFEVAPPATGALGGTSNSVYRNDGLYTYVHNVTPSVENAAFFNTGFNVKGFTGIAGWSFGDSILRGGCGGPSVTCMFGDFLIVGQAGSASPLNWFNVGLFNNWDANESIRFFFVSSLPPVDGGNYNLTAGPTGTAQSYAPAPEPGSLVLFGSGLLAAYGVARRRRVKP